MKKWPLEFFKKILAEGWNATPDFTEYVNLLKTNLNFGMHIPEQYSNVFDLLSGLYNNLYAHYKNPEHGPTSIIHCFFPDFNTNEKYTYLPNINRNSYLNMMKMIVKTKEFKTSVKRVESDDNNEDYKDYGDYQQQQTL